MKAETKTRWKKRRRESQISRKLKAPQLAQEDDVYEDEEEEDDEFNDDDNNSNQNPNGSSADRAVQIREMESVSEAGERISSFPVVIKRAVTRPHSSVLSMVATERAGLVGESRGQGQNAVVLENISHGQLQALSAVPSDCPSLAVEESVCGSGSYVITPPPIEKGRGVIKRFGSAGRVHVVPMHAGLVQISCFNNSGCYFFFLLRYHLLCSLSNFLFLYCMSLFWWCLC